jgi:cytochrome P450
MFHDPDFVPFRPPEHYSYIKQVTNYIESFPRSTYEEDFTRVKLPIGEMVFVCDPSVIEDILITRASLFPRDAVTRRALSSVLDPRGMFLAEGADWRWQRRAVAPAFRPETLIGFVPTFAAEAERQIEEWRNIQSDAPINIFAAASRLTLNVAAKALLGSPASLDANHFSTALARNIKGLPWEFLYALLRLPSFIPFPQRASMRKSTAFLHAEAGKVVAERRANPSDTADLLGLLLAARDPETGRGMSNEEITANVFTFIVAGHDTSSVAIAWTLWLLAKDQATQERVREEVAAVAADHSISEDHVEKLEFTREVIQESLRLFPPAPVMSRQASEDTNLGPHKVARGTRIVIPIWSLHRHKRLWPDPDGFEPERFTQDKVKARPRFAHIPFGGGARVCVGASFALLETTTILATLIRAFRFRPVPGLHPRPKAAITLRPDENLKLFVESAA